MKLQVYATIDNQIIPYVRLEQYQSFETKTRKQLSFAASERYAYSIFASDTEQDIRLTHESLEIDIPFPYNVVIERVDYLFIPELRKEKDKYVIARDKEIEFSRDEEMLHNITACAHLIMKRPAMFWLGRVGFRIIERNIYVVMNENAVYEMK